jgi:hypothetical protein
MENTWRIVSLVDLRERAIVGRYKKFILFPRRTVRWTWSGLSLTMESPRDVHPGTLYAGGPSSFLMRGNDSKKIIVDA